LSSRTAQPADSRRPRRPRAARRFWTRLSDGLEAQQLWNQFRAEARSGYEFYSQDIDLGDRKKRRGIGWSLRVASAWFWAIVMKLSPSRRVVLVLALFLSWMGDIQFKVRDTEIDLDFRGLAFLLLLVLLVLELADRVAMKRDLQIARDIQRWLAPQEPPRVPGVDIAFTTIPANTVSGDYYDAFLLDDDGRRLLLVVADVAGKSVPAALLMASLQACLHSCARDFDGPGPLMARLNEFACERSLDGQRFTTVFLAELDVETRMLHYINAGHNLPALRRADRSIERLEAGGLPLGVARHGQYESGTTKLEPGDLLFVFSDGLVDATDQAGAEFGDARVIDVVSGLGGESADAAMRAVIETADRFSGDVPRSDDITCLALRIL
jgi:serine phosphatase RsbU (regulator of sigma subunit)